MPEKLKLDPEVSKYQQPIRDQLNRILVSSSFGQSPKMKEMLNFLVEQAIAGNGKRLKQFTIATEVFERGVDFDHQSDPIVRIQAGRVRRNLETYYLSEGVNDAIQITVPKGTYCPDFYQVMTEEVATEEASLTPAPITDTLSPTITIVPFISLSDDKDQHFFAEGFAEDLATELSRFDTLNVVSMYALGDVDINPSSTTDIKRIGTELGVSFVTSGTMRTYKDRARIQARLYRTDTGQQVWAERYDCNLTTDDLFDVQDDIIAEIVAELASSFGIIHRQVYLSCNHKNANEMSTYEATLRYRHYLMTLTAETHQKAIDALSCAVEREPNYGLAWAMLAVLYFDSAKLGINLQEDAVLTGIKYARRAVELEPTSQEAQMALLISYQAAGDQRGIIDTVDKVVALNPNAAYQVGLSGWVLCLAGEFTRGLELLERSKKLNPYRPAWFSMAYILNHFMMGEYEQALKQLDQFSLMQLFWQPLLRCIIEMKLGKVEQAKASLNELLSECPDFFANQQEMISAYIACPRIQDAINQTLNLVAKQ